MQFLLKKKTYGKTEEIIGNWFENNNNREKVVLASKVAGPGLSWIRNGKSEYNKKNLNEAVNSSLSRLKTDYIDLYQLHWPERKTNYFGKLGYEHKDNDRPINAANTQNTVCAFDALILLIPKLI